MRGRRRCAGVSAEHRADLHLQSAWASYIAGNSKSAREQLKAAIAVRPDLQVVPGLLQPRLREPRRVGAGRGGRSERAADRLRRAQAFREGQARGRQGRGCALRSEARLDLDRSGSLPAHGGSRRQARQDRRRRRRPAARVRSREGRRQLHAIGSAPSEPGAPPAPGNPAAVGSLLESAGKALAANDFRAASSFAKQAAEADPRNAEAHRILGDAALASGQNADAEREFTAAIVLESGNAKAELGLGVVSEREKKWNTAASHYRRALDFDPKSVEAARGLGRSMSEIDDKSAARLAFGRAIEIDPTSALARNDLGVFLYRGDDLDRAIEALIEAVRLEPTRRSFTRISAARSARRRC